MKNKIIFLVVSIIFILGCNDEAKNEKSGYKLFKKIDSSYSNMSFSNNIVESDSLNYYNFPYIYMGGGVGIGDFNNDGLSDVFMVGNMVSNKLYLNTGNLVFNDVTNKTGTGGEINKWYTGVTVVDINLDGWQDIYLSVSGKGNNTKNELYINNGDLSFTEQADDYGIADSSASIQSTFFDYDQDGDLDLFVANYPTVPISMGPEFYASMMKKNFLDHSGHLYRNNGNGSFEDVTEKAGVKNFGLSLGLVASDLNNDGMTDLYISNDFNVPDYLYLNKGDGSFLEVSKKALAHTSMFGMGIDIADVTNDGFLDIVQVDMTPQDYVRSKRNMARMSPRSFQKNIALGLHYQYMQNSLQINNGINKEGIPVFSDISQMAGIATTDWSWSALFADLDNDGWKDLYITNGIKRNVNDNDINQRTTATTFKAATNKVDMSKYPSEPLNNYAFCNKEAYVFEDVTQQWGLNHEGFSNGMAYGDLDNDGDLDLVINNIDQELFLYENTSSENPNSSHYLKIKLNGPKQNPLGLGTKVILKNIETKTTQINELSLTRGFQSSIEPKIHFGLGKDISKAQVKIVWPDGLYEKRKITTFDREIVFDYSNAHKKSDSYKSVNDSIKEFRRFYSNINFSHKEDDYDDYLEEPLLPYKYSTLGPGLAVSDVNLDGLDDFFIGNAKGEKGKLLLQLDSGQFEELPGPWTADFKKEDTGALFFDADNDGDQDLYVVSGGYNAHQPKDYYQDRLYINTRSGFIKSNALPNVTSSGQAVAIFDFDKDGDLDLFVGGRITPGKYAYAPKSYLLENKGGKGTNLKFKDITNVIAPDLENIGMVTSVEWTDINNDGWQDLIVAGEWMEISVFINNHGTFENRTSDWGLEGTKGWWYSLKSMDVDNDGDQDIIAGNLGLNYKYKASKKKPFELYVNDFDANTKSDIVFAIHKENKLLPLRGRECSSEQIPAIKHKYETYKEFANADLADIYGRNMLKNSLQLEANDFAHYWLENDGGKSFIWHKLNIRSQFSPINTIVAFDYDQDEFVDLFVAGALYDSEVETPRADAGIGLVLRNNQGKGFEEVEPSISGLLEQGNIKAVKKITIKNKEGFIIGRNNDSLRMILFDPKK